MPEKLETHDKAQKTFLQNASRKFRTPLMPIGNLASSSLVAGCAERMRDLAAKMNVIIVASIPEICFEWKCGFEINKYPIDIGYRQGTGSMR